jgi:hypothetical protein
MREGHHQRCTKGGKDYSIKRVRDNLLNRQDVKRQTEKKNPESILKARKPAWPSFPEPFSPLKFITIQNHRLIYLSRDQSARRQVFKKPSDLTFISP